MLCSNGFRKLKQVVGDSVIVILFVAILSIVDCVFDAEITRQDWLPRRLRGVAEQDVRRETKVDYVHAWLPAASKQDYSVLCDPTSEGFRFGNHQTLSQKLTLRRTTWIGALCVLWKMVKLFLPVIFPSKPAISAARDWETVTESKKTTSVQEYLARKKPTDELLKEFYDPKDTNPVDFKANLYQMLPKPGEERLPDEALKYIEMCILKPGSFKFTWPLFLHGMGPNYPWNIQTQNMIFFAVIGQSFLDVVLTLFFKRPRFHWFLIYGNWFSMTFRPEIYLTVVYSLVRLWVNQWQLDRMAGQHLPGKDTNRIKTFARKLDNVIQSRKKGETREAAMKEMHNQTKEEFFTSGPLSLFANGHLLARVIIFCLVMVPFIPVTFLTGLGWVILGFLMAGLWDSVVVDDEDKSKRHVDDGTAFALCWSSVILLIAVLWAFGISNRVVLVLTVMSLLLFPLAGLVKQRYHNAPIFGSTEARPDPPDGKTDEKGMFEKAYDLSYDVFTNRTSNLQKTVYMCVYLLLCVIGCLTTSALSQSYFTDSANTYLCPMSQLSVVSVKQGSMGATVVTITFLVLASACLVGASMTLGKVLCTSTYSKSEFYYTLWLYASRSEDENSIFHMKNIKARAGKHAEELLTGSLLKKEPPTGTLQKLLIEQN